MLKITKSEDFGKIFRNGAKVSTPSFSLIHLVSSSLPCAGARIGVVASKKVGGAVQRNRCKRLLRAIASEIFCKNSYPKPLDLVMIAKVPLLRRKYELIRREAKFCSYKLRELYEAQ